MKKKIYRFLMLAAVCITAVSGCKKEDSGKKIKICYTDSEGSSLVERSVKNKEKSKEAQIAYVLNVIQKNTDNIDYRSPFVKGVKVKDWSLESEKLVIDFNRAYQKLNKTEEIILRAAVVESVGQISGVDSVLFTIEGESLENQNGQEIGYMQPSDFVQNTGSSLHAYQKDTFLLYYANKQGDRLVKEKVNIRYNSNMSREKAVVEQLIKGPDSDDETAVLPSGTKVLSVSVKDHICYVNLDGEFLDTTNVMNPEVPVYAIVNSIVDGSTISRVQILVDGKTDINYMGKIDLRKPLSRNPNIVEGE